VDIKIEYDGEYPALCMGHLFVTIDGKRWDFGKYCLESGGGYWFEDDYTTECTSQGEWEVYFPDDFPDELKDAVVAAVNADIEWGCCGGCI